MGRGITETAAATALLLAAQTGHPQGRCTVIRSRACTLAVAIASMALIGMPFRAQPQPPQTAFITDRAAEASSRPPVLGPADLDRLIEPFAGAPQDTLGVVLDACRYPSNFLDAARWTQQPEGTRGAAKDSWPPTVRVLAAIAWPTRPGANGLSTFIMNQRGEVSEREFGARTADEARQITAFDPGPGWTQVDQGGPGRTATAR